MNKYLFFNQPVTSDCELPLSTATAPACGDVVISAGLTDVRFSGDPQTWDDEVTLPMACRRHGDWYELRFPEYLTVHINIASQKIHYQTLTTSPVTLAHLLVDQVLPRLFAQRGALIMHAGAVSRHQNTLMLTGPTGAGKSTLCASLMADGWQLLSDDCVCLDPVALTVTGSYPGLRLFSDSRHRMSEKVAVTEVAEYTDKQRLALLDPPAFAKPLTGIVVLRPGNRLAIARLNGSAALLRCLEESFSLWPADKPLALRRFNALATMLNNGVPVLQCEYPHAFDQLDAVKALILAEL